MLASYCSGSSANFLPSVSSPNLVSIHPIFYCKSCRPNTQITSARLPYSSGSGSVEDWASEYLSRAQNLREMVDPTLETYQEDHLQQIGGVIKLCVNPDPRSRPSMNEVCVRMREITGIEPDGAFSKVSPLWWAELEIQSTEAS